MPKTRIFIFLDSRGVACARETRKYTKQGWQDELIRLAMKGYHAFTSFSIRGAWGHAYNYWLRWAVRNLGI